MTNGAGARLEVVGGKAAGQSLLVTDELIIGRVVEGPGQLGGDDEISRSHARLSVETSGSCTIEDLGSTNGTYVNGLRISAPQALSEGDTIELGGTTVVVQALPKAAGRTVTAPHDVPPPQPTPVSEPPDVAAPEAPAPPPEASSAATPSPAPPVASRPEPASESISPVPLHLQIDVEARQALLTVGDSETLRLVFEAGRWRLSSSQSTD
jgi:FHA domain